MREQGVVAKILAPGRVEVMLEPSEACAHCSACRREPDGQGRIEAVGPEDLNIGERVEIEISTGGVVEASFVVFLLPVLFLMVGYGFGSSLANILPMTVAAETAGIVGAAVLLAGSFAVVRRYDRKVRGSKRWQARVNRVIHQG